MGDLVDLDAFRKRKEEEEKAKAEKEKEETEQRELAELEYLKQVLTTMVASLPPVTGAYYVPVDASYMYDSTNQDYYPEEDIAPSDQYFFDYDWGWANEDDEDI